MHTSTLRTAFGALMTAIVVKAQYNPLSYIQGNNSPVTLMPSITTITVDIWQSCSDSNAMLDTITSTVTATTCPLCTDMPPVTGMDGAVVHKTVYTTTWKTVCDTGIIDATYTITEKCTGATPTWGSGPTWVPDGYTTTVTVCTVCGHKPSTLTLTVPCTDTPAGPSLSSPGDSNGMPNVPANPTAAGPTNPNTMATWTCSGTGICSSSASGARNASAPLVKPSMPIEMSTGGASSLLVGPSTFSSGLSLGSGFALVIASFGFLL